MARERQSPLTAEELNRIKLKGLTQKWVAALVGCSEQWFTTWKKSGSFGNTEMARRVAYVIRIDRQAEGRAGLRQELARSERG